MGSNTLSSCILIQNHCTTHESFMQNLNDPVRLNVNSEYHPLHILPTSSFMVNIQAELKKKYFSIYTLYTHDE